MIYSFVEFLQRSFNYAVAIIVKQSGSGPAGFLIVLLQTMSMVIVFGFVMWLLGRFAGQLIRGNFALVVLSGIGLFLLHNKIFGALAGASSGNLSLRKFGVSPSMAILSEFSAGFFLQMMAIFFVLGGIYVWYGELAIYDFTLVVTVIAILMLWSIAVGLCFMGLLPLFGGFGQNVRMIYMRLGMVTSGKFLVANQTPAVMYDLYSWNPLFHLIDQMRGALFINYTPFKTSLAYPIKATLIFLIIGMFLEFLGRRKFGVTVGS